MHDVATFQRLFEYDDWANAGHLEGLRNSETPAPQAVRAMGHLLSARAIWLLRLNGQSTDGTTFFPEVDVNACSEMHEQVKRAWQAWMKQATHEQLAEKVTFHDSLGTPYTLDRATMLTHVLLHSAHHRGQVAMAQRQGGNEPTDLDLYLSPLVQG